MVFHCSLQIQLCRRIESFKCVKCVLLYKFVVITLRCEKKQPFILTFNPKCVNIYHRQVFISHRPTTVRCCDMFSCHLIVRV